LVANEENAAKAECLELKSVCFWWGFVLDFESFGFVKIVIRFLLWLDFLFQKPIYLLKTSFVILSSQKIVLVLLVRFLRRYLFQVVSVTGALKLRLI
ncbi:hypothetical protein, partial [Vibrio parahaemolyticus]|uniref:hypothetical protein n=1 Tax=Vibrio parahaemolyticus TaxID=670 RepID=UPI0025571DE6